MTALVSAKTAYEVAILIAFAVVVLLCVMYVKETRSNLRLRMTLARLLVENELAQDRIKYHEFNKELFREFRQGMSENLSKDRLLSDTPEHVDYDTPRKVH